MTSSVFSPFQLGPVKLKNRLVKAATFEGMTPGARPSAALIEFHRRFAAGGVGMTTLAYCAVAPEGRTYADQIHLRAEIVPELRKLTDAVHTEGSAASAQFGHAGWFSNPKATGHNPLGPSATFSPYALGFARAFTADDFVRVQQQYVQAAELAIEAGFDAIEVHLGHGYLLSQFLSPYTNRRKDKYGGSIDNRARFPRAVLEAIRAAVGDRIAVYAKLNMTDGFDGGLTEAEGVEVAAQIAADETVDALQLTSGFTAKTAMYLLRGEVPLKELIQYEPDRLRRIGLRLLSSHFIKPYDFEEAFLLHHARKVRSRVPDLPLMLLGGVTRFETMEAAIDDEGFQLVALGRALLREPGLPARLRAGDTSPSLCTPCNRCITEMNRAGTRCVLDETAPTLETLPG